ncbi:putative dsRNA-binding protein [Deinococcus sp.]|uniref:putative dsRNA-binding protein n=1 Tax=Deinococcus sp. TaxID=47478 RepID=UPI0025C1BFB0|nr:double-stranded RNA binding motif domain-containing protein [Deinococcus sp.]
MNASTINAKGDLIARLISLGLGMPTFGGEASGPAHDRTFRATISLGGRELGSGVGRTKKDAERIASEQVLATLKEPGTGTPALTQTAAQTAPHSANSNSANSSLSSDFLSSGPWPIYAAVLAQAIEAATEFAAEDATLQDVQQSAAQFYRGLLGSLGHQPGEDL